MNACVAATQLSIFQQRGNSSTYFDFFTLKSLRVFARAANCR